MCQYTTDHRRNWRTTGNINNRFIFNQSGDEMLLKSVELEKETDHV